MSTASIPYLSLCSGIEAFSCAVHELREFSPVAFSEIEPFPCSVLAKHFPNVPNLGDMREIKGEQFASGSIKLVVGGTPCQGFSISGQRGGLDDKRSCLALDFVRIVKEVRCKWLLWENVPGALTTNSGRDFRTFLAALDELGFGLSWRILDSQFFGVPQRRKRIYLVGHFGDYRPAAAVLLESPGMRRYHQTSKEQGKTLAKESGNDSRTTGFPESEPLIPKVAGTLAARTFISGNDIATSGFCIPVASVAPSMTASGPPYSRTGGLGQEENALIIHNYSLRRFTPLECERLQGFPDNWTNVGNASDSARYRALGNSMPVPVMTWIARRMAMVDALLENKANEQT